MYRLRYAFRVRRGELGWVVEVARAGDLAEFHTAVLEYFDHAIGYEFATVLHRGMPGPVAVGFCSGWRATVEARSATYGAELAEFERATIAAGGVGVDQEFLGHGFEATAYYQELVAPERGGATLFGMLVFGGEPFGAVTLGRRRRGFLQRDKDAMQQALPSITVSEVALRASRPPALAIPLSRRERDIVDYLRLGYTNADIALALGTSANTVRNQLAHLFRKLGASNRAELVARTLGASAT